jgi:hypothetical protein
MLRHHNAPPQSSPTFTDAMHSVVLQFVTKQYNIIYNCEMSWSWTRWVSWSLATLRMAVRLNRRTYQLLQCAHVTGHYWWSHWSSQCYWTLLMITLECTNYWTLLMITLECTTLLDTTDDHTGVHNITGHYWWSHWSAQRYWTLLMITLECTIFLDTTDDHTGVQCALLSLLYCDVLLFLVR